MNSNIKKEIGGRMICDTFEGTKIDLLNYAYWCSEAYLEPNRISLMELFCENSE